MREQMKCWMNVSSMSKSILINDIIKGVSMVIDYSLKVGVFIKMKNGCERKPMEL